MPIKLIYNAKKRRRVKRMYDLGRNRLSGRGYLTIKQISDFTGVKPGSVWEIGCGFYCPVSLGRGL